ncbi:MAG TPA: C-type lectin domain-containing protein, partial [Polyangiaceae bacterium]|nr:C-type lectin domain-containing protein [Polyangiaceae bacterium]
LLVTTTANWNDAKNACAGMNGAHLVTISDATTDAFNAEDMFVYTFSQMQDTWLGLTDGKMPTDPGDGTPYTWITNEPPPPADAWQSGEPNNYNKPCMNGDSCYEHCGYMVAGADDKWNDDLCEALKQYVCEWDMGGS